MNDNTFNILNYNEIKEKVKEYCVSELGEKLIDEIKPSYNLKNVKYVLTETSEARNLIDNSYNIPLKGISDISNVLDKLDKDMTLDISDLIKVVEFLRGCKNVKRFFEHKENYAPNLVSYSINITSMTEIEDEINSILKGNNIDSNATKELKRIRRHIDICEEKIKDRLEKFVKSSINKQYLQDAMVVQRNGRFVVPIKSSYKNKVDGTIVDHSSTGTTIFIEPTSVSKHTSELEVLKIEEEVEVYKILSILTGLIYDRIFEFRMNVDVISKYDMIFAKAKYSASNKGIEPKLNSSGRIKIINGVHPLIENFEPLNFNITKDYRALLITGPNAGGKTVVLKTVGILTLMTLSGFHINANIDTEISVFENLFVDIGDNQSIENSLSTFSAHMKNLSYILSKSNKSTLVLLDEIGSGTEPNEGAGLGIAILEELYQKGVIILATTHYGEIKSYSEQHPDFENAAMEYKDDTLEPLYKLKIGTFGDSNAFYIAKKMGISKNVREKALRYVSTKEYDINLIDSSKILKEQDINVNKTSDDDFAVGDRVELTEFNKIGLIYHEKISATNMIKVFVDDEVIEVHKKRLKVTGKAKDLYPSDYDLDSLFTSFKDRKLARDIERGSKKALKKIEKDRRNSRE